MSEVAVTSVRNPAALLLPGVQRLWQEAFAWEYAPDPDAARQWVLQNLADPEVVLFLAREGDRWTGLLLASAHAGIWQTGQVLYLYARHQPKSKEALVEAINRWAFDKGIAELWAVNRTPFPDEEYVQRIRPGRPWYPAGSILAFQTEEPDHGER